MPFSRRSFVFVAKLVGAAILAAGAHSAVPQGNGNAPQAARGKAASLSLREGQEIVFTTPQFKVEALWFKANDETGWAWTGSDEVYAIFSDMDPTHTDRTTSEYDDVDEGDTVNFKAADSCMAPQSACDRGMTDLNVAFSFWEADWAAPLGFSYCNPPDRPGLRWRVQFGICVDDDLIGWGQIIYSREDLVAMLPAVGDSREFTAVMDKDAGKYRFRYRITRMPNVERSIVIHLPDDFPTTTVINLQANVIAEPGGGSTVNLTWSGASTSTVDIYRNGAKIVTTANDGTYSDPVGAGTYQYRVCELNSTTACSAQVGVTVP
jgi:hypothetical protein